MKTSTAPSKAAQENVKTEHCHLGVDPERIKRTAKVLRDLVADERGMGSPVALPEYKCEWVEEAATLLEEIAASYSHE